MLSKVIIQARLVRDPELKFTPNNKPVCSFPVANDTGYGDKKRTSFINIVAWNKTAEHICKYWVKGQMILVSGRLEVRSYDGSDGKLHYVTEIIAEEINFCGDKQADTDNRQADTTFPQTTDGFAPADTDDSLPF